MKDNSWLTDIFSEHSRIPSTLLCLYLKVLPQERLDELGASKHRYENMRLSAKSLRALVEDGSVLFNWENMEATLTEKGIERAELLLQEITER